MTDAEEQDLARQSLKLADVFYGDGGPDENPQDAQTLNMNDVWGWAYAWGEYVPDDALPEVERLFRSYGLCGLYYWVSERHSQMRSEFEDINRFVEFVRQEERIRKSEPNSSRRAYLKHSYRLGDSA